MGKWLFTIGIILVTLGLLGPLLQKIGFGHLPGDIRIVRKGGTFYFPITSTLLLSAILTIVLWLFRR